jgi:hypothetical protein
LIVVAVFIISAPIQVVRESGRSLSEIAAVIGRFLLVSAGIGWAWYKLGEEVPRQREKFPEHNAYAPDIGLSGWRSIHSILRIGRVKDG